MKEIAKKFKGQFECLRENTEKYETFSVPVGKEIRKVDKVGNEGITTVSYKIKFIDSAKFMKKSLSNLVDNLVERFHKVKCKD